MSFGVGDAKALATYAHRNQQRAEGGPYIQHPQRVAVVLVESGWDPEVIMAGWLHDAVEDTDVTLDSLRGAGAPERVVELVDALTRREGETYSEFIDRVIAHPDPAATAIKLADVMDNLASCGPRSPDWVRSLRPRYQKAEKLLRAALGVAKKP